MSRRSLSPPANILSQAITNGHSNFTSAPELQEKWDHQTPSIPTSNPDGPVDSLDPDDLFIKHSISEVKFIQQRLRADADAKQEELRLMVGARYRDLLQASTSIISLAQSSQWVKQALQETRDGILSREEVPPPRRPSLSHSGDEHLHSLQLLSVHMKLLLDTPEHLWRFIERKKYFPATWLFLLARVVHRALVREDEQDEGSWSRQGIDVLGQFPLVQRQWDVISQFRSQIIHKATMSLREHSISTEDTCAILLTLHLLDSRPLSETLSVFLTQRSKALRSALLWKYEPLDHKKNRFGSEQTLTSESRAKLVNGIKEATHIALDAISRTFQIAQNIFQEGSRQPLIRRVLEHISSDTSTSSDPAHALPNDLYLTTQSLLGTLLSSTYFQLLPLNLRSYKPHVDLTSPSSSVHHSQFHQEVYGWFRQSTSDLEPAAKRWFSELENVKAVWSVRVSTRAWMLQSGLGKEELAQMKEVLDEVCRHRMIEIWKLKLEESFKSFRDRLDSTFSSLNRNSETRHKQTSLVDFLLQAPPLPTISPANPGASDDSFKNYKTSLRRQIVGRSSLLNDILATLETCARTIRQDLAYVMASEDETQELVQQLEKGYQPDADALCTNVAEKLEQVAKISVDVPLSTTDGLVFLGRVSDELGSSSPFISEIGCQLSVAKDFRTRTVALHDQIIHRWRNHTVSRVVQDHHLASSSLHHASPKSLIPPGPSPALIESLLSLSSLIRERGDWLNHTGQQYLVQATLHQFTTAVIGDGWQEQGTQSAYDLAFLQKLVTLQGAESNTNLSNVLKREIEKNLPMGMKQEELDKIASNSFARMQNLLGTLLPQHPSGSHLETGGKISVFLPYGEPPSSDLQFQPAIELAKPTPRFGLLLV